MKTRIPTGTILTGVIAFLASGLLVGQEDERSRPVSEVTDFMLQQPPAADWLMWRRTYDSFGFSPLNQVSRDTVSNLAEAWRVPLNVGSNMATPLVHDGRMFLLTVPDTVLALDARSGEELWRYQHQLNGTQNPKIGMALHENKLLVPTSDMQLLALDTTNGNLLWSQQISGPGAGPRPYSLRSAPLVANGVAIQGVTATLIPEGGFIVGLDLQSGTELWRFHTVARPGAPGGNTWNDLPLAQRSGGSVWIPGSYDEQLDLVYFGVSPTYDTGPLLRSLNRPGISNEALYTNSTVALRPRTGELVWHYQHLANDQWDLDWIYERQLMDLNIGGEQRRAVLTAGKMALFDAVDAATGEYLFSIDLGLQNVVAAVDPQTGEKTINPATIPNAEEARLVCPYANGGRNWQATAYDPQSKILFVPLAEVCMTGGPTGQEGQLLSSGASMSARPSPDFDGRLGRLQAVNMETRELAWNFRETVPPTSAVLATAGGLVFMGSLDNTFKAFNTETGELIWQTEVGDVPASFPITYEADGQQFITLVVGQPSLHANIWLGLVNGVFGDQSPVSQLQRSGAALVTFALQ